MTGRNTTAIALGGIAALVGLVLIVGGMGPMGEHRDADGFYMSDPFTVDRPTHAVVSGDTGLLRGRYETLTEDSLVLAFVDQPDDVRMQGVVSGPNALFLGIAPTSVVDEYLSGAAHDEITDWNADRAAINEVEYATHQGTAPPGPPGSEGFWVTSVAGTGQQTLDWTIESGDWTAVIMNADASPGVTAELTIGAIALIGGGLLLYVGVSGPDR